MSFTKDDLQKIPSMQPEDWSDIGPSWQFDCDSDFCFPVKAMMGNEMVGIGNAIIYGNTAWLAHIIVHKQYRNNGIGSAVTKALIDLVCKTSCDTILLIATALGEPVYKKLGFDIQTKYVFLMKAKFPRQFNLQQSSVSKSLFNMNYSNWTMSSLASFEVSFCSHTFWDRPSSLKKD